VEMLILRELESAQNCELRLCPAYSLSSVNLECVWKRRLFGEYAKSGGYFVTISCNPLSHRFCGEKNSAKSITSCVARHGIIGSHLYSATIKK
jgi:hypothetical protein